MKTTQKLLLALCFIGANELFAQASASADAEGTIITPIQITKVADMNFGNLAVTPAGGTVLLQPHGDRDAAGGVTAIASNPGTVNAAVFLIQGEPNFIIDIQFPTSHTVELSGGGATMDILWFKYSSTNGLGSATTYGTTATTTLDVAGEETLYVGGELTVAGGQTPGVYQSQGGIGFPITVNYN